MASKNIERAEDLHFRVLKLLQDEPDLSQRELASRVGVSNGKLHYCMKALIEKGLVKLGNFAHSKHHLGYAYLLTPSGMRQKAAMTSDFLKRKMAEYEALQAEITALQADMKAQRAAGAKKSAH
jgi:EPS-associated MarR family transcriptional regulator